MPGATFWTGVEQRAILTLMSTNNAGRMLFLGTSGFQPALVAPILALRGTCHQSGPEGLQQAQYKCSDTMDCIEMVPDTNSLNQTHD